MKVGLVNVRLPKDYTGVRTESKGVLHEAVILGRQGQTFRLKLAGGSRAERIVDDGKPMLLELRFRPRRCQRNKTSPVMT